MSSTDLPARLRVAPAQDHTDTLALVDVGPRVGWSVDNFGRNVRRLGDLYHGQVEQAARAAITAAGSVDRVTLDRVPDEEGASNTREVRIDGEPFARVAIYAKPGVPKISVRLEFLGERRAKRVTPRRAIAP